jgi:2-desacetyl-2-hydroxyethyl bacteriochlorophyllide A dehydrogenase
MPKVSIVIRAFNEERHLPQLLRALAEQSVQEFETIVVDSGSFDRSRAIARELATRLVCIEPRDFTFGHSLNAGIAAAQGEHVVIVSAHTLPAGRDWLRQLTAPLEDAGVAMSYGRQLGDGHSKFSECRDFERAFGMRALRHTEPAHCFAHNANSALQRELWRQYPFDESLPGLEDLEWARYWTGRGLNIVYVPEAALYHFHEETWPQVRRRYYREAVAAKRLGTLGPQHTLREVWRESRSCLGDLAAARKHAPGRMGEVVRFRREKLTGVLQGLWDGSAVENPRTRTPLFFDRGNRAAVIHGPNAARIETLAARPPRPSEVMIQVAYEGVCGTDLEIYAGTLGYYRTGAARYPITPGHEFSGRVTMAGALVTDFREGDRVVVECIQSCGECGECRRANWTACPQRREIGVIGLDGGYAHYVTVPARFVHKVPGAVPLRHASMCEPLAVVLKGLKRLAASCRERGPWRCAVMGAGPIGHLAARILRQRGHEVSVYDASPRRLAYFEGTGITTGVRLDQLGAFDALIDATGDPEVLHAMLQGSGTGATLLLLGLPYARREFSFENVVSYDKTIVGSVGSSAAEFEEALGLLPNLDLSLFTQRYFALEEFAAAWECFQRREVLKVQLAVGPDPDAAASAGLPA